MNGGPGAADAFRAAAVAGVSPVTSGVPPRAAEGAEARGSRPACAGLDGPKSRRLLAASTWRRQALRGVAPIFLRYHSWKCCMPSSIGLW